MERKAQSDAEDAAKAWAEGEDRREAEGVKLAQEDAKRVEREADRVESVADLVTRTSQRVIELSTPTERNSQIMDASQLWASVQQSVTNGVSEEAKRIRAVQDEISEFRKDMARLAAPVAVKE